MSSRDGDRIAELEARLNASTDQDRQDRIRVLLALEHLTREVEKLDSRGREMEREISRRSGVIDQYGKWRREVEDDFKELRDALSRLDERYSPRDELRDTYVSRDQPGREYARMSVLTPLTKQALAIAAALLALAVVLALGGGDLLRRVLG